LIGYPARPSDWKMITISEALEDADKALRLIYANRFGYKRLAPAEIVGSPGESEDDPKRWRMRHDASTLGGNSGSAAVSLEFAPNVIGLHYGGQWLGGPLQRTNWAHALRGVLDEEGYPGLRHRTLRELAAVEGIDVIEVERQEPRA
jgi:hypothetical protein